MGPSKGHGKETPDHSVLRSRYPLFFQGVDQTLPQLAQAEGNFLVHVVRLELSLCCLSADMIHVSGCGGKNECPVLQWLTYPDERGT